jgi:hypothetical protein
MIAIERIINIKSLIMQSEMTLEILVILIMKYLTSSPQLNVSSMSRKKKKEFYILKKRL